MTRGTHRAKRQVRFAAAARWRQSWGLVLQLAVRDARSHRGRSILIMIMVLAPVMLIGSAATWLSTDELSARELVPSTLGRTEAKLTPVGSGRVEQLPDPGQFVDHDDEPGLIGLERRIEPNASVGPFDPPWIGLVGLVLVGVLSSVVAALLPARGAAKIKIADVLAGRERSQPVRAWTPVLAGRLMLGAAGAAGARLLVGLKTPPRSTCSATNEPVRAGIRR